MSTKTEPTLTEADADHIEAARLGQRQKNIDLSTVAEMAHKVLGKRCIGDDDADCWVIAEQVVNSEWFAARMADAWDEGYGDDPACNEPRTNPYRAEGRA